MHGFFGSYNTSAAWDLSAFDNKSFVKRTYQKGAFSLDQITLPKFLHDKYFCESDDCFLAVEGVLLEADSAQEAIHRYRAGKTVFWDKWRGSFCGLLYDRKKDNLILFNDHIGSHLLFYTQKDGGWIFASDLQQLSAISGSHTLNQNYVQDILGNGYSYSDNTFVEGVRRLTAGQYICLHSRECQLAEYHHFDNTPYLYNEKRMLEETNRLFRQAVERVIRKNEEECLQHFFPLSGGLDSRMAQWVAKQTATQPITNFTFSQSGHYDHLVPQEITRALGNQWLFVPLDGGAYITNVERACAHTQWLVNYLLPIEIDFFASNQNWQQTGVVLTGINGDTILAPDTNNKNEMGRLYSLGFNSYSLGSPLVLQQFTETYSPFCDVDVLDFVLHIPTDKRRNYAFYDRWVLTFYPEAAQWHHKHMQIGHRPKMVTLAGRNIRLRDVPKRMMMSLLKRLHIYDAYRATKEESMNPYDFWAKNNPIIKEHLQHYYQRHRPCLTPFHWLGVCDEKIRFGSIMETGKVLTVESAIENLQLH